MQHSQLLKFEFMRRIYRVRIELVEFTDREEKWAVRARNGGFQAINNRPLFRNKGLKHRRIDWKLDAQRVWNARLLETILEAIERETEEKLHKSKN